MDKFELQKKHFTLKKNILVSTVFEITAFIFDLLRGGWHLSQDL
jgi:hypothetical protein